MGAEESSDKYTAEAKNINQKYPSLSLEASTAIYKRFLFIKQNSQYLEEKFIPTNVFLQLFPFTNSKVTDRLLKYIGVPNNEKSKVKYTHFAKLFLALDPSISNTNLNEMFFALFSEEGQFDPQLFIAECRASLIFSTKDSEAEFKAGIKSITDKKAKKQRPANKVTTYSRAIFPSQTNRGSRAQVTEVYKLMSREMFDEWIQKCPDALLYARQLIFASFIFQ